MWNLLCQYNNVYKRKKVQTEDKKKKIYIYIYVTTIATVPPGIVTTVRNLKKKVPHQISTIDE